jgi:hypothetical protein
MPASSGVWADALKGTVAERLKELGVGGVLVQMAERGQLLELECEMPTCYSPKGARHFQYRPKTTPFPDWAPNADHYPTLKMDRGHLDPWNVRLAHVHCNEVDVAWRGRIRRMLEKDKNMSFEQIAEALNSKGIQPPPGTNAWSAATARKAYIS